MKRLPFKIAFFLFSITCITENLIAQHKIIYFISSPRSLSTAFMRMIQARGDFQIFHEPSQQAFFSMVEPKGTLTGFRETAPKNFKEVKELLFNASLTSPVFAKEICGAVKDFVSNDDEFLSSPNIYFVFMVRHPANVINSFYKVAQRIPSVFARRIGSKTSYEILQAMQGKTVHAPFVMFAEDLIDNPERVVREFCKHVDIPFMPQALNWQALGSEFDGVQEWHENKKQEITQQWHAHAIASTGFAQPNTYELDSNGEPTFAEVQNPEHRNACLQAYAENLPYYKLLRENYRKD